MTDQEMRLECLRLALQSMPIPGLPPSGYKSETVLEIAEAYYAFLYYGPEPEKIAA